MSVICREDLLKDIEESVVFSGKLGIAGAEMRGANKVIDRIRVAPAVDSTTSSGQWLDAEWDGSWKVMNATCSHCHERGEVRVRFELGKRVINSPYCPNCGNKM